MAYEHSTRPSLRSRIITASAWVLGGHFVSQLLRLISNLVMTRLLVPEMFGIMAVANMLMAGLSMISDVGIRQNIIQSSKGDDPVFLNTAWTVQVARGVLLWMLALMLAGLCYLANINSMWNENSVYAEPILPVIIAVLSFNAVIIGFQSTKNATAGRNLALGLVTRIEFISQVSGIAIMIAWAAIDRTIWALVVGTLFSSVVRVLQTHKVLPGMANRFEFDKDCFWEIFNFGKWIFLTSILGFLVVSSDRLILGGLVDSATLGLYAIAYFMIQSVQLVITKIVGNVSLPALSEVARENPSKLRDTYYKFRYPMDSFTLFLLGVIFVSGHHIIEFLYDARYVSSGRMLEILSITLFVDRFSLANQCFIAVGKPHHAIPSLIVWIVSIFTLVPVFYDFYGFEGALWTIGISKLVALPVVFYFKYKHQILSIKKEFFYITFLLPGIVIGYAIDAFIGYLLK